MTAINLLYTHAPHIGYGRMATEIHKALTVSPNYVQVYDSIPIPERTPHPIVGEKQGVCSHVIYATLPPFITGWWSAQTAHLITMWETDTIPPGFRGDLTGYESIIVPSQFCAETFAPFHPNIVRIPLGVNTLMWQRRVRTPSDFFEFLACGWGKRKGIDVTYRAFLDAFPEGSWGSGPTPRLTLKAHRFNEVPDHDRVRNLGGRFTDEEEVALYTQAHCMVAPSRGEGFGLQPLQAIAQGLPTILTDAHGHAEFAQFGLPISGKWTPVPPKTIYRFGHGVGNWFEPDYDQLVDKMRWVYDNYIFEKTNAEVMSAKVHKTLTWVETAKALDAHIGRDSKLLKEGEYGEWNSRGQDVVSVTPTQSFEATIGGHKYTFIMDEPTDVPLGVYEILSKSGYINA